MSGQTQELPKIPDLDRLDVVFGSIDHIPNYESIPDDFKRHDGNEYVSAVSSWFFSGAKRTGKNLIVDGKTFVPKDGIDGTKAIHAIQAILASFQPKHEHKEAGAAWLLSQWFKLEGK